MLDEGKGLSTEEQEYDPTSTINVLRRHVDGWRALADPSLWGVTPETARLLQHWRHHGFNDIQPFFCQLEAVETVIWLTEVAPGHATARYERSSSDSTPPKGICRCTATCGSTSKRSLTRFSGQFTCRHHAASAAAAGLLSYSTGLRSPIEV